MAAVQMLFGNLRCACDRFEVTSWSCEQMNEVRGTQVATAIVSSCRYTVRGEAFEALLGALAGEPDWGSLTRISGTASLITAR